ncbi:StbA domain-containing protein [Vibrio chagasii]|nr:StbA domain-containing protein [Vibrio chagasii]
MTDKKIIVADDGSTSVKLAWFEDKELKTLTVSNAAEYGRGFGDDGDQTFEVEGEAEPLTFFEAARSIRSKTERYQYDAHSVAAIHYALSEAGFKREEVKIAVTLPLSQFYKNGRKNEENIKRKKENILRHVKYENGGENNITEILVYPEGIPAVYSKLVSPRGKALVESDELTFLADMGGTTLDLCLFSGAANKILKAESFNVGMFDTFDDIKAAAGNAALRDNNIRKLLETGSAAGGKIKIDRMKATAPTMKKAQNLIVDFLGDDIQLLSNCFCIGGGAGLLAEKLVEVMGVNPEVIDHPVEALATSIASIANK